MSFLADSTRRCQNGGRSEPSERPLSLALSAANVAGRFPALSPSAPSLLPQLCRFVSLPRPTGAAVFLAEAQTPFASGAADVGGSAADTPLQSVPFRPPAYPICYHAAPIQHPSDPATPNLKGYSAITLFESLKG